MYCKEIEQTTEQRAKRHTNAYTRAHAHTETVNTEVTLRIREEKMNYSIHGAGIIGFPYKKLNSK